MDRRLERIRPVYAKFLMLRDKGLGDEAIANRLDKSAMMDISMGSLVTSNLII